MTETVTQCDVCAAALGEAERVYVFNGFALVRCRGCGLVLTNPRPTRAEIGNYYGDGYYSYLPPDITSFKQRIKDAVLGELGGYPVEHWWQGLVRPAAWFLEPHIMVIPPHVQNGRLLDAGCGAGTFLSWAVRAGWDATGLEVDPRGVEGARAVGLNVVQGSMEDCLLPDASFDTVVLNHTLEHCHDPNRVLAQAFRVLKPGGLIIVGVPNFDCYDNHVFGDCWSNCEAPRHLYHFNPETLTRLLEQNGFGLERLRMKKWLIPYSQNISFRFLRRKLEAEPWPQRARVTASARWRIHVVKKLAMVTHFWPDEKLAQMMTAYAHRL